MTFSSRLLIFFLFFSASVNGARWPWIITSTSCPLSTQKSVVRSRASLNKTRDSDRLHHLFPDEVTFKNFVQQESLDVVCANVRKKRQIVRVLLAECDAASSAQWRFASPKGFTIQPIKSSNRKQKKIVYVADFAVTVKHGSLFYKGKRLKYAVRLRPVCGYGEFNGVSYDGDFCIMPHKDSFLCINQVELEDYIAAVLRTESWPGWPLEVNKVFAIACRSYGAYKVMEAQRSGRPYHVKNSNAHQTYQGRHDLPVLKAAVEQTKGIVLGFEGKPVLAMFDCCCGGIIPAYIDDFDFYKVPYLARTYACTHCKESSLYSWQVSYEQAVFDALLKHYKQEIALVHDIHIIKKDKAGLVTEVKLNGPKQHTIVSGKKLYSMLKEVKSFHFDVYKKSGKIVFTGRGFGHHIGLCQWGARQMVRDGWDYTSILRFYYPGVYFMRLI
jgi:stage II sporulation protein D